MTKNDNHRIRKGISRGMSYLKDEDYNCAEREFSEILSIDPQNANALNERAICNLKNGRYDEAVRDFSRALKHDPSIAYKKDDRLVGSYAHSPIGGFHPGHRRFHPRFQFIRKIINTFLTVQFLWQYIANDRFYQKIFEPPAPHENFPIHLALTKGIREIFFKILCFNIWPTFGFDSLQPSFWAQKKLDHKQYVYLQPSSHTLLNEIKDRASHHSNSILDLGCNRGRHLNALLGEGFTNLHGVDISSPALEDMDKIFPDLSKRTTITHASFQQFLSEAEDDSYDIVFTHGVTIEFVHASFPLVKHLSRITRDYIILVINENGYSYPRFWTYEFARAGFVLVKLLRPAAEESRVSLLVFRTIS